MEKYEDKINKILQEVTSSKDITLSDIPDIDLYMDQVITLFENKLGDLKRNEADKIMTKTMINNYAKAKILPPVKNKKYNKQQIILLTLVYNLKQAVSLNDINTIFNPILKNIESGNEELSHVEDLYNVFLEMKSLGIEMFEKYFNELENSVDSKSKGIEKPILLAMALVAQANLQRRMAEKIIDNFLLDK